MEGISEGIHKVMAGSDIFVELHSLIDFEFKRTFGGKMKISEILYFGVCAPINENVKNGKF